MTPWVMRLLVANVVVFFATQAAPQLRLVLAFQPLAFASTPWTLFTYMFVHANGWHLLFNMIGLFFFGPRLELRLGSRSFLWLYFLAGLGGALFSFLEPRAAVIGASAAVYGVLLGFAYFWPRELIYIWGVLPVQAWMLASFFVFVSLWSGVSGVRDGTAHFAHLGGLATGFLYLWFAEQRRKARVKAFRPDPVNHGSRFQTPGSRERDALVRWRAIDRSQLHALNRDEVEQLLDRAESEGVGSLSSDERAFLDRMSGVP
ncbi:MAG: rhomboid family intramembrane serine protease [Gemmatimonadota bacterium]